MVKKMIYSEKLKEIREENKLTQKDIAIKIGISSNSYERYENEHDIFPLKHLITTCDYLKVSLDYIFNFSNENNYQKSNFPNLSLVGKKIKEIRKENKLTQVQLAKILNIGNGTLADYERGRYLVSTAILYTICSKYKISADYILGKNDNLKYLKSKNTTKP